MNAISTSSQRAENAEAQRVIDIRLGGKTERCHTIPHQGSYSVAAHSWGAAMLLHAIWPEDFNRLALVMLAHDVGEGWVGDVPSPTMRYSGVGADITRIEHRILAKLRLPQMDNLSPEDREKILACDRLEFYLWCRDQQNIGNCYVNECLEALRRMWVETPLPEAAQRLFDRFHHMTCLPQQSGVVRQVAGELFGAAIR